MLLGDLCFELSGVYLNSAEGRPHMFSMQYDDLTLSVQMLWELWNGIFASKKLYPAVYLELKIHTLKEPMIFHSLERNIPLLDRALGRIRPGLHQSINPSLN